ncbi:FAD-dependent oxidoreductase [Acidomonas methanolica]|uniref:Flavin-dependent monooxygenase n=1 Tax=Acidomonas methanolica NBRC 104435 TaxID=1231351 RepID=A0A023D3K0_ACIMT|nr:NAD(P)/FAD-dependent oxidoreductase [Acidomonas methanolica]TCS21556.1 2-polyprenyl-6-methoxyphenol hydroxylase-like FAD-dependent oxidoreductase [Acidomonas methanolica]GAJ28401.1 monooxygenase [Acidomonas methanolica NBRC 104435]GEL00381.1 FAD-dependent oxidoreductase [Acidomonas methanolica NBRC 104435]
MKERIGIVGGGPGGLMLARLLQRQGMSVTVFERDAHADERPQGGSLDLHEDTGQRAIRAAGLEAEFAAAARPEDQGDRLYDEAGCLLFEHDGHEANRPEIDRSDLRRILLDSLAPGVVRWGQRVTGIASEGERIRILQEGGGELFDIVVGADGAWSRVRSFLTDVRPVYQGVTLLELGFDETRHPHAAALAGHGKMFAVGDNRAMILQRNGHGHLRFYCGVRMSEEAAAALSESGEQEIRARMADAFAAWALDLRGLVGEGNFIGVRPMYAMPIGTRWVTHPGITLLGDAAHLMSPFSGEGVNLALADAFDLAEALTQAIGMESIGVYEATMAARAEIAATGAAAGLTSVFSDDGPESVLTRFQERIQQG